MSGGIFRRGFAFIAAAVLATAALVLSVGLAVSEKAYISSNAEGLERAARAAAAAFGEFPAEAPGGVAGSAAPAAALARDSGYRITLVDSAGRVAADTAADSAAMENHLDRPEIAAALAGKSSWARRRSATTGQWMLYAASPLRGPDGAISGAVRLSLPLPDLMEALGSAKTIFIFAAAAAALIALAASGAFVGAIARPVEALSERARRYAEGKAPKKPEASFTAQPAAEDDPEASHGRGLDAGAPAELRALSLSLDAMATQLTRRADEARELGERYSGIIASAAEAILALDTDLRIVEANPAAHSMFGAAEGTLIGAQAAQLPGGAALADLATRCLAAGAPVSDDIALYAKAGTTLHASASPLGGAIPGVVLTATDISVMKRLETMRRDFVANVSHELRTPIHLIRGYTEALRAGASTEESAKYLEIIERSAVRMERIVSDLLQLARLERDPADWLHLEPCSLDEICASATEAIQPQASAKSVKIVAELEAGLRFSANAGLVEQALVNLLENAVRYSPEGSNIRLEGKTAAGFVELCVRDYGPGIPSPDLERIFERFYRADKSRDRKSGGTGLGLAIVRHIALAHGGSVSAESWAGEGSLFMLRFPLGGTERELGA